MLQSALEVNQRRVQFSGLGVSQDGKASAVITSTVSFFKPMRTIGDKLRNGKDLVHPCDRQGAIYCVPCGDCDQKYFGETKMSFKKRKKEHISYIKHFYPEKSALAAHALELEHRMNWSKTQIVAFENDFRRRRFTESFFINSTPNVINEKSSDLFPKICRATFGYN